MSHNATHLSSAPSADSADLQQILQLLRNLRFGSLEIIVHEGRIVQIERREKLRVDGRQLKPVS